MMKNNNNAFLICFLLLSFMNAFFVSAADQVITWKKEAQEIDLYSDEALKIQWTGTHDVWLHDAAGCAGGDEQMAPETDSNWSALAGSVPVGTHYLSCRVGNHCEENMTLKVTSLAGSRPATTTTTTSSAKKSAPFATGFAVLAAVSALFC
jgi:hypothetical protein